MDFIILQIVAISREISKFSQEQAQVYASTQISTIFSSCLRFVAVEPDRALRGIRGKREVRYRNFLYEKTFGPRGTRRRRRASFLNVIFNYPGRLNNNNPLTKRINNVVEAR